MRGSSTWQHVRRLLVLLLGLAAIAGAEEPPVSFDAIGYGLVTITGEADTLVSPGGRLVVDGPLAFGDRAIARVNAQLNITAFPGETFDFGKVETFRACELDLQLYRVFGRMKLGTQEVTTGAVTEWGFTTAFPHDPAPRRRYPRHYGIGARLEERTSGAVLQVLYGRAEIGGDRGFGQWMVRGAVPIGPAIIGGDAVLSVGPSNVLLNQRDVVRLWVGASLPELVGLFKR